MRIGNSSPYRTPPFCEVCHFKQDELISYIFFLQAPKKKKHEPKDSCPSSEDQFGNIATVKLGTTTPGSHNRQRKGCNHCPNHKQLYHKLFHNNLLFIFFLSVIEVCHLYETHYPHLLLNT